MRAATAAGSSRGGPAWARARGRGRADAATVDWLVVGTVAAHPGRPAGRLPQPAPVLGRPVRRHPLLRGQGGADVPGGAALPGRGHRVPAGQRALHHPARPGGRHRRRLPARLRLRDAAGRRRRAVGRDPAGPGRRRRAPAHPPGLRAGHGGRRAPAGAPLRHRPGGVRAAGGGDGRRGPVRLGGRRPRLRHRGQDLPRRPGPAAGPGAGAGARVVAVVQPGRCRRSWPASA